MTKERIIKKTKTNNTFLVGRINGSGKHIAFNVLICKGKFSPCCGCVTECIPEHCDKLVGWTK